MVDYYGSQTPLAQVANVNTPDGRTITVQPWGKSDVARNRTFHNDCQFRIQPDE